MSLPDRFDSGEVVTAEQLHSARQWPHGHVWLWRVAERLPECADGCWLSGCQAWGTGAPAQLARLFQALAVLSVFPVACAGWAAAS